MSGEKRTPTALVWLDAASKAVVIFGAVFAVIQFVSLMEDKRIERTLAYLDRLEESEMPAGRSLRALLNAMMAREADLQRLAAQPLPPEQADSVRARYAQVIVEAAGSGTLLELDRFFNNLVACLGAGLCHEETVRAHFQAEACWLLRNFLPEFERQRMISPRLGEATAQIAALSHCEGLP